MSTDIHVYVDDVLVSTTSFQEHINRLEILFQQISTSNMTLKFSKCHFFKDTIKFLGHIITSSGMQMDPDKLKTVYNFPPPRNVKELQSFIGFCNFYRKFSDHHASLMRPLIDLIKKDLPWKFGPSELAYFNEVKKAFNNRVLSQ